MGIFAVTTKMGFDFAIDVCLHMCSKTGKPFFYGTDPATGRMAKLYELPDIQVPEDLRDYLELRGHFLHTYVQEWDEEGALVVSVDRMRDAFPSWQKYKTSIYAEEDVEGDDAYWTEEDHNKLLELLDWCCHQPLNFQVSWSY